MSNILKCYFTIYIVGPTVYSKIALCHLMTRRMQLLTLFRNIFHFNDTQTVYLEPITLKCFCCPMSMNKYIFNELHIKCYSMEIYFTR